MHEGGEGIFLKGTINLINLSIKRAVSHLFETGPFVAISKHQIYDSITGLGSVVRSS